jgi:hypothetical protein
VEEDAKHEIKSLLGGAIPERKVEMEEYIDKYPCNFFRCDDRSRFVIEAGSFGILKFTQRTMHIMWLLGFAYKSLEENKYKELIEAVYELANMSDPTTFSWPNTVPNPKDRRPTDIEGGAVFDLICMAGAYVFLHEIRHIMFCEDKNAPDDPRKEELECDLFARSMMLDKLDIYSKQSGCDSTILKSKRAMGISLALFFMLVVTPPEYWSGTESHPSIAIRIESMIGDLQIPDNDIFWQYAVPLFLSHLKYLNKNTPRIELDSYNRESAMTLVKAIENVANGQRKRAPS